MAADFYLAIGMTAEAKTTLDDITGRDPNKNPGML